ncbi:MAG TPA: caspase family protein [Pyrinomonadaceae bacterium]|nr:caspase family protein [Pyrinomonadaceae bacterium]
MLVLVVASVGWICTTPAKTETRHPAKPAARPPMYALQVGIRKYKYAPVWAELKGAVNDVVGVREVLESERYGVPAANIVTLTDDQATKENILKTFQSHLITKAREHFEKTKNRDTVVMFQFSGHGSQVPDLDGDEKDDGRDETLVTVDSQDVAGKNYDITDDEIFALTSELRRWTDNIVYIFDSCHSGSGTRNAEDVRRLPERKTVPVAYASLPASATRAGLKAEDGESGVMPPGDDYIVITAARPNELASQKNCFEECGNSKTPVVYGNLSYYLIDELKNARSDTSYRELMENVTRRVTAEKPTQTPQIEGDKRRFVFGGLGSSEDNFVRITAAETKAANGDRLVSIAAGAMQGVAVGTIVSFYDKVVTRFDEAEKISSGTVTAVTPNVSTVKLIGPTREIVVTDKSVVLGAELGTLRLKVDLDVDAAKMSTGDKSFVAKVRELLVPPPEVKRREIDVVKTTQGQPGRWDVALLKDKFSSVASKVGRAKGEAFTCIAPTRDNPDARGPSESSDRDVYYLAGRDFVPVFGFCMEATNADDNVSADRLRKAIAHMAAIKIVKSISNRRSALASQVIVKPVRLRGAITCSRSALVVSEPVAAVASPDGSYAFAPLEALWFEVENRSAKPLYAAALNIEPSGAVILLSPRGQRIEEAEGLIIPPRSKRILPGGDCRTENGEIVDAGARRASRTPGTERFKFIFSTGKITHDDFAYLERPPLANSRDGEAMLGPADWTTVETILKINDTGN